MIRIGILGYGNLARGVESAIRQNDDMELVAVFTRRDPAGVKPRTEGVKAWSVDEIEKWRDKIDVLVLGGGSATDLPEMTPKYAAMFNVVDSFDTHASIPGHFAAVDAAAKQSGKVGLISIGWDPGLFSLLRMISTMVLPEGSNHTYWGRGVSQGHSDAIRRIPGVKDARQYTVPIEATVERVRRGENPELTPREQHLRECYVVAEDGADKGEIERQIKTMPNYFADYDTTVTFITQEQMKAEHSGLPHGGFVLRSGVTGWDREHQHIIEFNLKLGSNPEFTGSVIAAYARAAYRLSQEGVTGCKTIFDIPPAYLSSIPDEELRAHLL